LGWPIHGDGGLSDLSRYFFRITLFQPIRPTATSLTNTRGTLSRKEAAEVTHSLVSYIEKANHRWGKNSCLGNG